MISKFKNQNSVAVFWLVLLSIIVHLKFIITPPAFQINPEFILLSRITNGWNGLPSIVLIILYQVIVVVQAVRINYAANFLQLHHQQNALAGMCYILFTGLLPQWGNITGALIANCFFIGLMPFLKKLHEKKDPGKIIFNISFFISAGILLYPPLLPLAAALLIGMFILTTFRLNYLFIFLCGLTFPFYLLTAMLFLRSDWHHVTAYLPKLGFFLPRYDVQLPFILMVSILGLHFLLGFYFGQVNANRIPFFARKIWVVIILLFLLCLSDMFFFKGAEDYSLILCLLPLAIISSNFYSYVGQRFWIRLLYWLTLGIAIYNNWTELFHFFGK